MGSSPRRGVFLREATGLVRDFGTIDSMLFAIGSIIGPFWVVGFASEWYLFPGVNIPVSIILVSILALANGFYYVLITAAFPRSGGGGYIPLSRTIHPALGMVMSFLLIAGMLLNIGFIANITLSVGLAGPLQTYATITNNAGLQSAASVLSTPTWVFAIGSLFIIGVGLIAFAGNRAVMLANKVAFILGTLGILAMIAVLISTTNAQFTTALDRFAGSDVYQNVTATAANAGWHIPSNWVSPTVLSLPVSFFIILGYAFNTYYAGEVRKVTQSMSTAVIGSIVYAGGFFALLAFLMERTFGSNFITSATFLFNTDPGKYPLSVPPWVNTFVAVVNSNPIINLLIMINFVSWGYFLIITFYFIPSRHFLAYSLDGAFPARLGNVSDRFHSPAAATALCGLIGIAALGFIAFFPTVAGAVNVTYLFIAALTLDGLAGVALVLRKKSMFEGAPSLAKKRIAGIPVVAILGAYSVVFIGSLLALSIFNPDIIGPLGAVSEVTIASAIILALISYFGMKYYKKSKGIDITLAFREIPPE